MATPEPGDSFRLARSVITVRRDLMYATQMRAADFRQEMTRRGTLVVQLLSSPGAGKTSLLEATAKAFGNDILMSVLVGDIATDRDAQRLADKIPVVQLTTGGACHLEFPLVERGWNALGERDLDFLFIENVGNLVCPAAHDLGEHLRVVLLSTTEGDDKPAKYPKAFRTSHALLISKTDLLPYVPFDCERAAWDAKSIQPDLDVMPVSTCPPTGLQAWFDYLNLQRRRMREGQTVEPRQ